MKNTFDFIAENVPKSELLILLGEEASELAQAALKLRRASFKPKGNETPVSENDAYNGLLEEMADVELLITLLVPDEDYNTINTIMREKLNRWKGRIEHDIE